MNNVDYWRSEATHLREILHKTEMALEQANALVARMQRDPLSDERIYAMYRHSLDWRQLARDVEAEHGVGS
jgi:hypothetical protein